MSAQPETINIPGHQDNENEPDTGLFFNILSFDHPEPEIEVSFTTQPSVDAQRFSSDKLPAELTEGMKASSQPVFFYTCFEPGDPGQKVKIQLADYPAVSRAWYTKRIRDVLAPETDTFRFNFLKDTQFWCLEKNGKESDRYTRYYRFTIRVQHDYRSYRPELIISFDGTSHILKQNLEELTTSNPDNRHIKTAAFRKRVYNMEHLPEAGGYHPDEVFPILNRDLARTLGIEFPFVKRDDTYDVYYHLLHGFVKKYCETETFRAVIPHDGEFKKVLAGTTGRIDNTNRKLLFGENNLDTDPYQGMKKYGPVKRPEGNRFCYFFIYFEQNEKDAKRLYKFFLKQEGFIHLEKFTRLPLTYTKEKNIILKWGEDPEAQVESYLKNLTLEDNVKHYAFYISPYTKFEPDEQRKRLYFRIKELLLYRKISMQAVESKKLQSDFKNAIANIGFAMVAKLGGAPWRLEGAEQQELVIGFGAYRRKDMIKPYIGSTVCFGPDGLFREFDVFPAANTRAVAGSAMEAFRQYRKNQPNAERIIIHFYKRMSYKELEPLEKMLKELKLDIPVIVAGISQNRSKSLVVFNRPETNVMPVDGTWTRCGATAFLLNVNMRKSESQIKVKQTMPLKVEFQCTREGYLDDEKVVAELLNQIYAFGFMHWRSVRQSPVPVTIRYPALIASFLPWFRQKMLSAHGRTVPWFL